MTTRASLNVTPGFMLDHEKEFVKWYVATYKPTTILVMDDVLFAQQLLELNPEMIVVHRAYSGDEHNLSNNYSPEDYVLNQIRRKTPDPRLHHYISNEPVPSDDKNTATAMFNWHAEVTALCHVHDIRAVIGNWPSGAIAERHLQWGCLDQYITVMYQVQKDRKNNDILDGSHQYFAAHEGTGVHYDANENYYGVDSGLDKSYYHPDNWLKKIEIKRREPFIYNGHFHMGRSTWVDLRAIDIGLGPLRRIITEYGTDRLRDVETHDAHFDALGGKRNIYDHIESVAGASGFQHISGIESYRDFFYAYVAETLPGWNFAQWCAARLKYADAAYSDNIIGFQYFTMNRNDPWLPRGFHIDQHRSMFDLNSVDWQPQVQQGELPVIPDLTNATWYKAEATQVHSTGSTNARVGPGIGFAQAGRIYEGDKFEVAFMDGSMFETRVDGYDWVAIRNNDGAIWWVGGVLNMKLEMPDDEPTTPAPDDNTVAEMAKLFARISDLEAKNQELEDALRALDETLDAVIGGPDLTTEDVDEMIQLFTIMRNAIDGAILILSNSDDEI
jgi:hypothetical protein